MKLLLMLLLSVCVNLAMAQQEPKAPTVEESLAELVKTSKYLMRNLSFTTAAYSDTARQLLRDAQAPGKEPYLAFLKEIAQFEKHADGYTVFKWPHALHKAASELNDTYGRRKFLEARVAEQSLRTRFLDEVHPAYWQTLTTTYVWIEYVRRAYLYNELVKDGTEYYEKLTDMLGRIHEQAQALIGIMGRLRNEALFATDEAHFESRYARYFHAGNVLNFGWKRAQPDLTHYFAPYFYPLLVPNENESEVIERMIAKYPQLRDSAELKKILEDLKKKQQEASSAKPQEERPSLNPSPMNPPSSDEGFMKEPEYVMDNPALQAAILKLQYQVSRQELSLDAELIEVLKDFASEVQKLVEKHPKLTSVLDQCRHLINAKSDDYDSKALAEAIQKILNGESGLRPGYPAFKPLPPTKPSPDGDDEGSNDRIG